MKFIRKITAELYKRSAFWCLLSGSVYSLQFANGWLFAFGFVGMFLFALSFFDVLKPEKDRKPFSKPFVKALCFSLGCLLPLFTWFWELYPFEAFGFTKTQGVFIVIAANLGLAAAQSLMFAVIFLLMKLLTKSKYLLPVNFGVCFVLFEWLTSLTELAFPWCTAAVGQYRFLPLIQSVSVFGWTVIVFIVAVTASAAALGIRHKSRVLAFVSAFTIAVPVISGSISLLIPAKSGTSIDTALLQGNIPSMDKWDEDRLEDNIAMYEGLAVEAAESGAKLIIMPESALPTVYSSAIGRRFSDIAEKYGCDICVSGICRADGEDGSYNSLFILSPGNIESERYAKRHLVPFGEYIPFADVISKLIPFVGEINLSSSEYLRGTATVIGTENYTAGCLICYDSIFAPLAAESVRDGAEFLIISTNDSWYNDSPAVYQHMAQSVIRAVETGRTVARAANTGVSCFISPKGVISGETEPLVKAISYGTVETSTSRTVYSYISGAEISLALLYITISLLRYIAGSLKKKLNEEGHGKENDKNSSL